jgi:F-type H+-transporting ATPase subunit b
MAEAQDHDSALVAANLAHADTAEGLNAGTEAHGGGGGHAVPSALGLNPTAWVALAMAVFIVILLVKKVPSLLGRMLDSRIAAIREQLDEAKTLRAEAEALRAEYEKKLQAAEGEASAMREHAEAEAKQILVDAKIAAKDLTVRRARMAEAKIGAAERAAIAEIREKAVDAAATAAANLIAQGHGAAQDKPLVDRTIADLGTRLN